MAPALSLTWSPSSDQAWNSYYRSASSRKHSRVNKLQRTQCKMQYSILHACTHNLMARRQAKRRDCFKMAKSMELEQLDNLWQRLKAGKCYCKCYKAAKTTAKCCKLRNMRSSLHRRLSTVGVQITITVSIDIADCYSCHHFSSCCELKNRDKNSGWLRKTSQSQGWWAPWYHICHFLATLPRHWQLISPLFCP